MAFNINPGKQQFSATASQTVFTFNFAIFASTDLKVYKTLAGAVADDTADLLTISTHYTVSINGTLGGTVTLLSGASLNDTITVVRVLPVTRTTDYVTNGDLYADTLDLDQDYQTYLVQDGYVQLNRAIIIPESLSNVDLTLPAPISDTYLRWNTAANALENDDTIPQKLIDSQTAATTATTQAGIATTQAALSTNKALESQHWANYTTDVAVPEGTGEFSAKHYATKAATSAASVNDANIMHLAGDETASGVKSFSAGIKVEGANVTAYGKNYIINGGFDYWNYATTQTSSGYGSADRWYSIHSGSTKTISKQFSEILSANVMRTVVTSVAGANNYVRNIQRIENITKYAGKTITLSFKGQVDSNKSIAVSFSSLYGTGGAPSAQEDYGLTLVPLTTTFGAKTVTVTVPSITGKVIGTDGVHTSFLQVQLWFDAGSGTAASSLGQQSGTFDIAEVKLEEGSVSTPWTPYEGEFGGELQACQRYLPAFYGSCFVGTGVVRTTTAASIPIQFKTPTRVQPTGLVTNTLTSNAYASLNNGNDWTQLAVTFSSASTLSANTLWSNGGATMTVGQASEGLLNSGGYIYFTGCEL